jgi:hypothetical protein
MTLHQQYAQLIITGVIEIIFGLAIMAGAGWFLWKRYVKNKPNKKLDDVDPNENKGI